MHPVLLALIDQFGIFMRWEAIAAGYDDRTFDRVAARLFHQVRHGAYTTPEAWAALDGAGRHLLRARAAYRSSRTDVALSHVSSVLAQTDRWWDLPLADVHLTRLDGRGGRREAGRCVHRGLTRADDLEMSGGYLHTSATRVALELPTITDGERSIVVMDGLLHAKRTSPERLLERYHDGMARDPRSLTTPMLISFADGRSESVGETKFRWSCKAGGLPIPELQHPVFDLGGSLLGVTDFWWPDYGYFGEFDGRIKYGRLLKPGQSASDVVFAEKRREDAIREATNCPFIRFTWWDVEHPIQTHLRIERALRCPRFRTYIL